MPEIHLAWMVLCQRSLIDQDSNSVSIIECVEQLAAPQFPTMAPFLSCVALFYRHEGVDAELNVDIRLAVEPPGRDAVILGRWNSLFAVGSARMRVRVALDGLGFRTPGLYHFRLDLRDAADEWKSWARLPVWVIELPSDSGEPLDEAAPT